MLVMLWPINRMIMIVKVNNPKVPQVGRTTLILMTLTATKARYSLARGLKLLQRRKFSFSTFDMINEEYQFVQFSRSKLTSKTKMMF